MKSLLFPKLHLSSLATSVEAEPRRAFTVSSLVPHHSMMYADQQQHSR